MPQRGAVQQIGFSAPTVRSGHRIGPVTCYNPASRRCIKIDSVLIPKTNVGLRPQHAYYTLPFKKPVPTTLGHIEFCRVLVRRNFSTSEKDSDFSPTTPVFEWTNQCVAVKVSYLDRVNQYPEEDPFREIAALQLLGDRPVHVVGAIDALSDDHHLFLIMRYCQSGDFFQLLKGCSDINVPRKRSLGLSEGEARYWFLQLVKGVQFLHSRGICHRDLSPENIMIDCDEVLIIDLGMCLRVQDITEDHDASRRRLCRIQPLNPVGKLPYMSPEVYENREFDGYAADVWMCGTILFCMLTGNRSYRYPSNSDPQFYWMTERLRELLSNWEIRLSQDAIALLESVLKVDPLERSALEGILLHPWFTAGGHVVTRSP